MTTSRPAGPLNQEARPINVRDQTTATASSPLVRSLGADIPALRKMAASPEDAAYQALAFVEDIIEKQNLGIELYGFGPYYGDESSFAVVSSEPRQERNRKSQEAMLKRMLKPALKLESVPYPQPINCVELLFAAMTVYRDSQLKPWGGIIGKARDARSSVVRSGRGTVLIEQARREDGFTTWYYSRNVSEDADFESVWKHRYGPPHGTVVRGTDSHKLVNVGVHIDKFAANFAPGLHPKPGTSGISALNTVPFALGAADWGYHTFIFSCGSVYEAHWADKPNQKVFEKTSFAEFSKSWTSGVIGAAPGQW